MNGNESKNLHGYKITIFGIYAINGFINLKVLTYLSTRQIRDDLQNDGDYMEFREFIFFR